MMEDKIKCLYYIKDIRTDKIIYIGQTKDFKYRKHHHFSHKNQPIDEYMYNEGRDNFLMEMFNIDCLNISDEEILKKEDELILKYNTLDNGFNIKRSGLISKDTEYRNTEERKEYLREYQKTEKRKEYEKKYHKAHRERYNELSRQYRLRKKINNMSV